MLRGSPQLLPLSSLVFLVCHLHLVAPRGINGRGHGLFAAFPWTGDPEQHLVYEAESVQLVGTADARVLEAVLRRARDDRWYPLRMDGGGAAGEGAVADHSDQTDAIATTADVVEPAPRTPLSIGIGQFKNTSIGSYLELALAFPACEEEAHALPCDSFMACQDKMPDCAHTYMHTNFVSDPEIAKQIRLGGINAQHASEFRFGTQADSDDSLGRILDFSVRGPHGEEVLEGTVQAAVPFPRGGEGGEMPEFAKSRPGFRMQPFVGPPHVLGTAQARHLCAFPDDLAVVPARVVGPVRAGGLLVDLDFKLEGALHLSDLQVVRLPPWGVDRAGASGGSTARAQQQAVPASQTAMPPAMRKRPEEPTASRRGGGGAPPAPPPPPAGGGDGGIFGDLMAFDDATLERSSRAPWAGVNRGQVAAADAEGAAARAAAGAHQSQHKGGGSDAAFPWHMHDEAHRAAPPPSSPGWGQQRGGPAAAASAREKETVPPRGEASSAAFPWASFDEAAATTTPPPGGAATPRRERAARGSGGGAFPGGLA